MRQSLFKNWHPFDLLLPFFVLLVLLAFTYGIWFEAPYWGFYFNPQSGEISSISPAKPLGGDLRVGDRWLQIGSATWGDYYNNGHLVLFDGVKPGETVPMVVLRNGQKVQVNWVFPGFNREEFFGRFINLWWLPFVFLVFGAAIQLLMRPKDARWGLLLAANYLTGLWLAVGSLSAWRIWESSIILHVLTWLILPVYLALHWIFPRPLRPLPRWVGWLLGAVSIVLALLEVANRLPRSLFGLGFALTLLFSLILLGLHFWLQPQQRREVGLLLIGLFVALAPVFSLGILVALGSLTRMSPLAFVAFPIMPAAYFYSVYRRQLGGLEVRANQLLSLYAFLILVAALVTLVVIPLIPPNVPAEVVTFFTATIVTIASLITALGFPVFHSFVERRIFGIKLPYDNLQESYAARIVVSHTLASLIDLLQNEVVPSLMVRQFVFLRLQAGVPQVLFMSGVTDDALPQGDVLSALLAQSGKYRLPAADLPSDWVRLALPLQVGDELLGVWLLGRRDPDDLYAQVEIPILQSLAHQTAIALSSILRAESLRVMYQTDINRHERERLRLAHELHDNVLNEMAALLMSPESIQLPSNFMQGYRSLTQNLRGIASDLRPPTLEYGLKAAFMELAENLMERTGDTTRIRVDLLADDGLRYDEYIEQNVYRIIQQGCENALRHGHAADIRISGTLAADKLLMTLEDDGSGFDAAQRLDLSVLLAGKHFGLAGMYERAAIIDAQLKIDSALGKGTRVYLTIQSFGGS